MSQVTQKKIALINDFTGFGRCSMTVELPIISALKVQCCPVPTAVLSNHTGFNSCYKKDLTSDLPQYINEWKKLNLNFDCISSGYLGSIDQISVVKDFFEYFKSYSNIIIVDPVMGDHGKLYTSFTPEMAIKIKELIKYADIITPNLTEACFITDSAYSDKMSKKQLLAIAKKLNDLGPKKIVITGIKQGRFVANYCFEEGKEPKIIKTIRVGTQRSGTGDIFAAIIAADAVNKVPFDASVKKASSFVKKCILKAIEVDTPITDGVPFELLLSTLK